MALIEKSKIGALVDSAKKGVNGIVKSGNHTSTKEVVKAPDAEEQIETIDQLQDSLVTLEGEMSPAMLQVLKSQIQVLGTISSPTMTGMMIDNLVLGLKQSMDEAESTTIPAIRDSYIRLIQNYVFMAEAKMRYVVDKNKEEANRMLAESGKMLADTFADIAAIAVPAGKARKIVKSVNKNMFEIKPASGGDFFSNMVKVFNAKSVIEEKQKEFFSTIENLFDTFEKYPDLFGPSILINGMLSKYRKILVERYADSKIKVIKNRKSVAELQKASQLSDDLMKTFKKGDIWGMVSSGVQSFFNAAISRKATQYDLQTFFMMYDAFDAELKELKAKLSEEESRLKELELQKKQVGFFNFSGKKETAKSIEEQLAKLADCKKEVLSAEKKLKELKALLPEAKALKEDINRYESRLISIEQLYLS